MSKHPYLLLVLAVLFWAGNFILGRAFHTTIPPIALAFWRWLGAALLITLPACRHVHRDRKALVNAWPVILIVSVLGITAFNTLAYTGLQYTQAINGFLMQSLMPVLIVGLSWIIFDDRIRPLQALGIFVSLVGAIMIIAQGKLAVLLGLQFNRGDLFVAAAVLCYAGYSVMLRKRPPVHPLAFIATTFWLGTALILPFYIWEILQGRSMQLKPATFMVIGYVAVFPSIISYLCYNRGVELIGANRAGLFIHLMPVFGTLMAIIFLDEHFYLHHAVGFFLIAVGIFLSTREIKEQKQTSP